MTAVCEISMTNSSKLKVIEILEEMDTAFDPSLRRRILEKSNLNTFEEYLNKVMKYGVVLVAHQGSEILGFLMFYANDIQNYISYIPLVGIKKDYQGQGVGKYLLSEALGVIKKKGMKKVQIKTWENNERAILLYKKMGFMEISRQEKDILLEISL